MPIQMPQKRKSSGLGQIGSLVGSIWGPVGSAVGGAIGSAAEGDNLGAIGGLGGAMNRKAAPQSMQPQQPKYDLQAPPPEQGNNAMMRRRNRGYGGEAIV